MKRLLMIAVLAAAVSQVQAGAVMPCSEGYRESNLMGSQDYTCSAVTGTRGSRRLGGATCKPGFKASPVSKLMGGNKYTCYNLK